MVTARARHVFSGLSAAQVYDAWTQPDLVRQWMSLQLQAKDPSVAVRRVEIDPVVGGRFLFSDSREGSEAWGLYKALERPERIVFSWFVSPEEEDEDNSTVTLEIASDGAGCVVEASYEMSDEWADYIAQTAEAWRSMLEAIDVALSKR